MRPPAATLALLCVTCVSAQLGACAHGGAAPPVINSENSPTGANEAADRDLSHGGSERGAVEFALAGVTGALSITLITLGGVQLKRSYEIRDYCDDHTTDPACTPLTGDPYVAGVISSSLSFFFAVPSAIASGFLLRRGLRTRRDYDVWQAKNPGLAGARVTPWLRRGGGGVGINLRF
ncbi:MAG: hypothetical protein KC486_19840 [Myxococcales bacterium]|nr:hypothetical protein [Myxococcales bacterium]